jgi:hypothetical protein
MSTPNPHHGQNTAVLLSRLRLLVVAGLVSHFSFGAKWQLETYGPSPSRSLLVMNGLLRTALA